MRISKRLIFICILVLLGVSLALLTDQAYAKLVPPQRVAVYPASNSHDAEVTTPVSITYDQDMDPLTVDWHSFAVHARQTGWLTETLSVDGGMIMLQPSDPLHAGELVQVSATTATLSLGGESPISPTVWEFTTAPWGGNAVFHEHQILTGMNSRDAALGDLDGDGDLDAITTSCYPGAIRVYHNNGFGTFTLVQSFNNGGCLTDAELGDLDGDGNLDVVIIDYWQGGDIVLFNNGDGTFTDSGQHIGNYPDAYAELGDLDGDGDLDLFTTSAVYGPGTLRVWKNDGHGIFSLAYDFDTAYEHTGVALGDLDGNGDLDAFTAGWDNTYNKVWLNDGTGIFSEVQSIPNANTLSVQLGDLDNDGDLDAYLTNINTDNSNLTDEVWLNDGTGHFIDSGQRLETISSGFPALGDLDADGDLDVYLSGGVVAQSDEVWANDGTGNFTLFRTVDENYPGGMVSLGDLDGDGNLDAFAASQDANFSFQIYLNGDWTQANPIPHITSLAATIHCLDDPNGFYLLGGYDAFGHTVDDFRHYDAASDEWTTKESFPGGPASTPVAACYAGKIYAAYAMNFYIYDIASNTWTAGPNPPRFMEAGGMGVWDGSLYVVGGYNGQGGPDGRISQYNITSQTWTLSVGYMPYPVWYAGWAQIGPYLYCAGGTIETQSFDIAETYRYDISTNTWEQGPSLPSPRWGTGLVATSGRLYALGGSHLWSNPAYDEVYYLDPSNWPDVEWSDFGDPLPVTTGGMSTACTEAFTGGEIWSTGGSYVDDLGLHVLDTNLYHPAEPCLGNTFALMLAPDSQSKDGYRGHEVVYNLTITNTGDVPDAYDVAVSSVWTTTVSAPPSLWSGESALLTVTVDIPPEAKPGNADTATITITSQGDPTQEDIAAITTIVTPTYDVYIGPESLELSGFHGEVITYTLTVTNTGDITDTINLTYTGSTWEVVLPVTSFNLGIGEGAEVVIYVTIPDGAWPGNSDVLILTAASAGDPSANDSSTLTTTAFWYRTLVPLAHKN